MSDILGNEKFKDHRFRSSVVYIFCVIVDI